MSETNGSQNQSTDREGDLRRGLLLAGRGELPRARRGRRHRGRLRGRPRREPDLRAGLRAATPGHVEVVQVEFDPSRVCLRGPGPEVLRDPRPDPAQPPGPDVGWQYRSVIFTEDDEQAEAAREVLERNRERVPRADRDRDRAGEAVLARRGVPPVLPREAPAAWAACSSSCSAADSGEARLRVPALARSVAIARCGRRSADRRATVDDPADAELAVAASTSGDARSSMDRGRSAPSRRPATRARRARRRSPGALGHADRS